jgi:hypothetical protein
VTIKRNYYPLATQSFCFGLHVRNHRAMPFVHTVVCANRDYRSLRRRGSSIGITKNKHEYLRYRFGQNH